MKQTNYFPHDAGARNDEKLIRLRMRHGAAGYGVYFMVLERLREETDFVSVKDYNMIAFDLRVDAALIKSVVEDFGLFAFTDDGKCFYSVSFSQRMTMSHNLSTNRRKAALKRWGKSLETNTETDDGMQVQCKCIENGMQMHMQNDAYKTNKTKETNKEKKKVCKEKSEAPASPPAHTDDALLVPDGEAGAADAIGAPPPRPQTPADDALGARAPRPQTPADDALGARAPRPQTPADDALGARAPRPQNDAGEPSADPLSLADRQRAFWRECLTLAARANSETLRAFFGYWSEPTADGRMRRELERTWDTPRRLAAWLRNEAKWAAKRGPVRTDPSNVSWDERSRQAAEQRAARAREQAADWERRQNRRADPEAAAAVADKILHRLGNHE